MSKPSLALVCDECLKKMIKQKLRENVAFVILVWTRVTNSRQRGGVTDNKLINKYQEICRKMKLTWHHLDDLDDSLKSTFQLVYTPLHKRTTLHMGSNAQLLEVFNQLKKQ